jgi:hypothetical protein
MWANNQQSGDAVPCPLLVHPTRRSPNTPPQLEEEPAGSPLGAGSRRRGLRTEKARRGPARTAGRFR